MQNCSTHIIFAAIMNCISCTYQDLICVQSNCRSKCRRLFQHSYPVLFCNILVSCFIDNENVVISAFELNFFVVLVYGKSGHKILTLKQI